MTTPSPRPTPAPKPGVSGRVLRGLSSTFAFGRNMHLIVASAFLTNVVGTANYQYLPLYIRRLGGAIDSLAAFYSIQTVVLALLVLVGGWLVDRFNRRPSSL